MSNPSEMNTQPFLRIVRQQTKPTHPPLSEMQTQVWQRPLSESAPSVSPHHSRKWLRLVEMVVILLFLMISVVMATVGTLILYQVDWIVPGVSVAGFDVGHKSNKSVG